jgi:hypothetical protein
MLLSQPVRRDSLVLCGPLPMLYEAIGPRKSHTPVRTNSHAASLLSFILACRFSLENEAAFPHDLVIDLQSVQNRVETV